jgi:hypothetical protein
VAQAGRAFVDLVNAPCWLRSPPLVLPARGALFVRAVLGMALSFTYFVADNFALAMGNLGAYPPGSPHGDRFCSFY